MKLSVVLPHFGGRQPDELRAYVDAVGRLGYDGVFTFDTLDAPPGVWEGAASLGWVAALAPGLRVGTMVLRAPLRPLETTLGIARTARALAGARLVMAVGVGDAQARAEHARWGLPFESREERLAAAARLVDGLRAEGIEVWLGGTHPEVVDLARRADAWNVWGIDPAGMADLVASSPVPVTWAGVAVVGSSDVVARRMAARTGGDHALAGSPSEVRSQLGDLAAAGVTEAVLSLSPPTLDVLEGLAGSAMP